MTVTPTVLYIMSEGFSAVTATDPAVSGCLLSEVAVHTPIINFHNRDNSDHYETQSKDLVQPKKMRHHPSFPYVTKCLFNTLDSFI